MAEQSYFWNGTTVGDAVFSPYDADEFVAVLKAMTGAGGAPFQSGVFIDELQELAPSIGANAFGVFPGRAQVHGNAYINTAPGIVLTIPSANATSRRDRIVLRKDWAAQTVRITRIPGTEGVGPGAYINVEGITWDMPLFTIDINTIGTITVVSDDRVYLPYITELVTGTLPSVTNIPNLILSEYTKNLITVLNNLASAPALISAPLLDLSTYTENLITLLNNLSSTPNLISAPSLNYNGLTGLVPPMVSLWIPPGLLTSPPTESNDVVTFSERRIDTTNGAMWNPAANTRINCVLTGLYEVSAVLGMNRIAGEASVTLVLNIRRDGTTRVAQARKIIVAPNIIGSGGSLGMQYCILSPTIINLTAGQYVELVTDHFGETSPDWATDQENMFTLKYVGARTPNCVGSII